MATYRPLGSGKNEGITDEYEKQSGKRQTTR
jgi:hypothetical protein